MKDVTNCVVKTDTSDSTGYVVKSVSTTTAGPGGCVIIQTEEEKRFVFLKETTGFLVPELPPQVYHVPIFPTYPVFSPTLAETSTNTENRPCGCNQTGEPPAQNPLGQPPPPPTQPPAEPPQQSTTPQEPQPTISQEPQSTTPQEPQQTTTQEPQQITPQEPQPSSSSQSQEPKPCMSGSSCGSKVCQGKKTPRRKYNNRQRSRKRVQFSDCSDWGSSDQSFYSSDWDSSDTEVNSTSGPCWCENTSTSELDGEWVNVRVQTQRNHE